MDLKWVSKVCFGGRREPAKSSGQLEVPPLRTGACVTCGGRFHLDAAGFVPPHRIPVRRSSRP